MTHFGSPCIALSDSTFGGIIADSLPPIATAPMCRVTPFLSLPFVDQSDMCDAGHPGRRAQCWCRLSPIALGCTPTLASGKRTDLDQALEELKTANSSLQESPESTLPSAKPWPTPWPTVETSFSPPRICRKPSISTLPIPSTSTI
jgi:hypothetical protein